MANVFDHAPDSPFADKSLEPVDSVKRSKKRPELTASERRAGQVKLYDMVERAFHTLNEAMENADFSTAVKAAQIILDRTGFGPKSSIDVTNTHIDLSQLSKEELAERASKLAHMLRASGRDVHLPVIDVTPNPSIN